MRIIQPSILNARDFLGRDKSKNLRKPCHVCENLKLRSGEATSTQVLAVMSAGTRVKLLALGKAETIDGISSNWVKVEVHGGAKDKDGNAIHAGTTGWDMDLL